MADAQARDEGDGDYEIGCGDVEPGARGVWGLAQRIPFKGLPRPCPEGPKFESWKQPRRHLLLPREHRQDTDLLSGCPFRGKSPHVAASQDRNPDIRPIGKDTYSMTMRSLEPPDRKQKSLSATKISEIAGSITLKISPWYPRRTSTGCVHHPRRPSSSAQAAAAAGGDDPEEGGCYKIRCGIIQPVVDFLIVFVRQRIQFDGGDYLSDDATDVGSGGKWAEK
ncbi:hypothetical protein LXL04_011068 [Taraxacum kok-saghyz]